MASQFLYGTYKSYKAGTESVFRWLYENAVKAGYGSEDSESAEVPGKAKKSKAKPKAKKGRGSKAKGSGKAKPKKTESQTKLVPVREFTLLAEAIASSEDISVPLWVISMIREVISARKKAARWFSQQAGNTTYHDFEESNTGHQHFIGVLENVLELLDRCKKSGKESSTKTDEDDPVTRMTNLFEVLEVEEIDDTEHEPMESTPGGPRIVPKAVFEEEPSAEEVAWIIYCFFEDFNIVRRRLSDMWTTYKSGNLDLITVSLATNTAFEMFQRAETELMMELKAITPKDMASQMTSCEGILNYIFIYAALRSGKIKLDEQQKPISSGNNLVFDLFILADWICLPVYLLTKEFLPVIQPNSVPICTPGFFGKLNLNEDVLYPNQKFQQDKIVLLELFIPEIIFLARTHDPNSLKPVIIPGQDALTMEVLKMIKTKEIPLWLVLALQVHLDIHYMLLKDMHRPFDELSVFSKKTAETLRGYLDFSRGMDVATWPKSNDKVLEHIILECEAYIDRDFLDTARTAYYKGVNRVKQGGDHVLLKRHPLLCGMQLFRLTILMHDLGSALCNGWGALASILHLYNAALMEGVLTKPWLDMEAVILANTEERIFIGGRPTKPEDYYKRFLLAMGASVTEYSANQRAHNRRGPKLSPRGPRKILASPAPLEIHIERYLGKDGQGLGREQMHPEFTLGAIEKLLDSSPADTEQKLPEESDERSEVAQFRATFNSESSRPARKKALKKKFSKSHKLTNLELLDAVISSISNQPFALHVNYFSLHIQSFKLLHLIQNEFDPLLRKYLGPVYFDNESQLPFLTDHLLEMVAGSSPAGRVLMVDEGGEGGARVIRRVGVVLERFIEMGGEKEIERVRGMAGLRFGGLSLDLLDE